MAEMVFSAVVEETLKQALSGLIGSNGQEDAVADVERLEMAQMKLEAALDASRRWRIRDAPLLRWRRKLKRAAEECGGELRERRRRVAAEDDDDKKAREKDSFPRRLARAATGFFGGGGDGRARDAAAAVRRFEWYADGAGEFLRFVELGGGSPRRHTPRVDPLIGRLLAGEELRYRFVNRRGQYHQFCVRPVRLDGRRGVEAKLIFVYEDDEALEKNLCLGAILRLSESTDLVGTLVKCLELLLVTTPHFRPAAESARRELVALPSQDFSWVPSYLDSSDNGHWNAMHSSLSQWFRPNPLCCNAETTPTASELEPVIGVFLQRHIPLAEYNAHLTKPTHGTTCLKKNVPHLRLGLHFYPHGSSDMAESAAVELVGGEDLQAGGGEDLQAGGGGVHWNISSLEELDEFVLPKAIDRLLHRRRPEAAAYQLFWKAKHGTAFLEVEKITGTVRALPRRVGGSRRAAIQWRRDTKLAMTWTQSVVDFFNLWAACAPRRLQGSIAEWVRKANDMQLRRCLLNRGLTSSY